VLAQFSSHCVGVTLSPFAVRTQVKNEQAQQAIAEHSGEKNDAREIKPFGSVATIVGAKFKNPVAPAEIDFVVQQAAARRGDKIGGGVVNQGWLGGHAVAT